MLVMCHTSFSCLHSILVFHIPYSVLSPYFVCNVPQLLSTCSSIHLTPHTSHLTPHTSHLTPHTSYLTPPTSHLTPHTSHLTPPTSHLTPHTSYLTPPTSHLIPHTSYLTPHTSHLTPHTTHLKPHTSHHPPHIFKAVALGETLRILRNCSQKDTFEYYRKKLIDSLKAREFPPSAFRTAREVEFTDRDTMFAGEPYSAKRREISKLFVTTKYKYVRPSLAKTLHTHWLAID